MCFGKFNLKGLTAQYQEDIEFLLKLKMLPSLAFIPEQEVVVCFNIIMDDFPESALNIEDISRRPTFGNDFQIKVGEFHNSVSGFGTCTKGKGQLARTNMLSRNGTMPSNLV